MTKEEWDILLERYNDLKLSGNIQDIVYLNYEGFDDVEPKEYRYEEFIKLFF